MPQNLDSNKKKILCLAALVASLFGLLFIIYFSFLGIFGEEGVKMLSNGWTLFEKFVLTNGFWLFCSIAILPALVLPVAPLLTLAGIWGGQHGPWLACLYTVAALLINVSWTYWFASKPGRSVIKTMLSKTKYKLPEKEPENLTQWAIILRLTPGMPFIFSNYILGFLKMPFPSYLLVSAPILSVTACGYVLIFAGVFGGEKIEESAARWGYVYGGIALVLVMTLIGRIIMRKKKHAN